MPQSTLLRTNSKNGSFWRKNGGKNQRKLPELEAEENEEDEEAAATETSSPSDRKRRRSVFQRRHRRRLQHAESREIQNSGDCNMPAGAEEAKTRFRLLFPAIANCLFCPSGIRALLLLRAAGHSSLKAKPNLSSCVHTKIYRDINHQIPSSDFSSLFFSFSFFIRY